MRMRTMLAAVLLAAVLLAAVLLVGGAMTACAQKPLRGMGQR